MSQSKPVLRNIYDNILVLTVDGVPLCRCSQKKAEWYVKRDLATMVSNDPDVLKLKFKTRGLGHVDDDFYLAERFNGCVVCENITDLTRHHVVPYCFRKHFPDHIKSHNSHDVVPLCLKCHGHYEKEADKLKASLGFKYGIKYGENVVFDCMKMRVKRYGTALMMYRDRIPQERVNFLLSSIKKYYGKDEITNEDILAAANLDLKETSSIEKKKYGETIVSSLKDLEGFVKMWRSHFVDVMSPKHMPSNWTINRQLLKN
jgi:hypothetical protein